MAASLGPVRLDSNFYYFLISLERNTYQKVGCYMDEAPDTKKRYLIANLCKENCLMCSSKIALLIHVFLVKYFSLDLPCNGQKAKI